MRILWLVVLAAVMSACGNDSSRRAATPTSPPSSSATATVAPAATATPTAAAPTSTPEPTGTVVLTIHEELLPTTDEMLDWIGTVESQGIRRPGYPADRWAEQWIRDQFLAYGLEDVHLDPVEVKRWLPEQWSLTVWPENNPANPTEFPCFPLPYSQPAANLEGAVVPFAEGADLTGKISVVENPFIVLPQRNMIQVATRYYDPDGEFETLRQRVPFSFAFQNVMQASIDAGAVGFIGILKGLPWESHDYYVPYDAIERPIPGVWVSPGDGIRLQQLIAAGAVQARINVDSSVAPVTSYNVIGTLAGASDEWIVIGSHHDGPWSSAVEDGSGIAMVLAQARYWSQVPQRERPHNLLFVLNAGHVAGGAGLIAFVERNKDAFLPKVVLEVHLEHAAREARGENGQLIPTDKPEVRWWFTSRITPLEDAVEQAIRAENLGRSLIMPPDGFPPGSSAPPTDGAFFHPAGVPIMNFLTAPMYLFDAQDTLDKVHGPSLVPVTRAAIRVINAMQFQTAAGLRAVVRPPPAM